MKIQSLFTALKRICIIVLFLIIQLESRSQEAMRANLFIVGTDGSKTLLDGNLTNYHDYYSNLVDWDDAWKMTNPGENFGVIRNNTTLIIERRSIIGTADTTFFRMWNMRQSKYEIKVMTKNLNHPGLIAYMKDNFLNTQTPVGLHDTTYIPFSVNASPGSYSQLRFELIYANLLSAVPVTFTGLKLSRKNNDIYLEWGVDNEISIDNYSVEHSSDGLIFSKLQDFLPTNTIPSKIYSTIDLSVSNGDHFYRIKATSTSGKIQYSQVAKISGISTRMKMSIYPNPVMNKMVKVEFASPIAGKYTVNLLGMNGSQHLMSSIYINTYQRTQNLALPGNIKPGMYQVQFIGPGNNKFITSITVL